MRLWDVAAGREVSVPLAGPVETVYAGHSRPFGRDELGDLIDQQLEWRA